MMDKIYMNVLILVLILLTGCVPHMQKGMWVCGDENGIPSVDYYGESFYDEAVVVDVPHMKVTSMCYWDLRIQARFCLETDANVGGYAKMPEGCTYLKNGVNGVQE